MKKLICLIMVMAVCLLAMASCSATLNVDETVEQLCNEGLTLTRVCSLPADLANVSTSFNSEIALMGGDFTVELEYYTALILDGNYSKSCQLITFSSEDQADAYAELYLASRRDGSDWKVAQSGRVVVVTNIEIAQTVIDLEFH